VSKSVLDPLVIMCMTREKVARRSPLVWVLVVEDFDDVVEEEGLGSLGVGGTYD
jgi:hypothetical protein